MSALPNSQKTDRGKARQERNTLPSGTLGLAMSKCPVLLSANRHGCVAGWITHWPFHLRNHNLNPAGSHQRINGQRHSYFKVIKHYKKGKGGTFIFLNHGFGHRFNWLPWLCYYKPEPGSRTDKLPAIGPPDLRVWHRPTATARQTFPHKSIRGTGTPLLREWWLTQWNILSMNSSCWQRCLHRHKGFLITLSKGIWMYLIVHLLRTMAVYLKTSKQTRQLKVLLRPPNFVYYQHTMNKEV